MRQLLGQNLPMGPQQSLPERIQTGHRFLVQITGRDFGYDPQAWHQYLRESNKGGYRWSNKHLGMPRCIEQALRDPAWRQAIVDLSRSVDE
jgi:hypothetical protein